MLADPVVDHALAVDRALFLGIESSGIILEILNDRTGFRAFIENLGLAFVNGLLSGHWRDLSHLGLCCNCTSTLKFAPPI